MKELTITNLVNAIKDNIVMDKELLTKDIEKYLWPRLDFMKQNTHTEKRYMIFENNYVETEWKDMISEHYINTSYKVSNTVMRFHIFSQNSIEDEYYCGFFSMRKIDEPKIMLSHIYPSWDKLKYDDKPLNIMTYKKMVHIQGKEIRFNTYPLFIQDNITIACAQANMISMSEYLHNKFDFRKIRIKKIESAYSYMKSKSFPTKGLHILQMMEVFDYYDIPVLSNVFQSQKKYTIKQQSAKKENVDSEEETVQYIALKKYLDYNIESSLPVLLGVDIEDDNNVFHKHIIQIIGHAQQDRDKYVIYDDSGYFLRNIKGKSGFVSCIEWDMIYEAITKRETFIIYPVHDKVYFMYDDMSVVLYLKIMNSEFLKQLKESRNLILAQTRYLLVDNIIVKKSLLQISKDNFVNQVQNEEIEYVLNITMSHYVWYCEIPLNNGYFIFIADTTFSNKTTKDIFYNNIPIYTTYQLGLLNYDN